MPARLEEVLARRLRELAEAKGIALSHIADRAAVARSYLWRILDAESSATLDVIQRLADAIGVAPLDLLVVESAPPTSKARKRPTSNVLEDQSRGRGKRARVSKVR